MINTQTNNDMTTSNFTVSYINEIQNAFKGNGWKRATNKQAFDLVNYFFDIYGSSAKEILIDHFGLTKSSKIADMTWFYREYELTAG